MSKQKQIESQIQEQQFKKHFFFQVNSNFGTLMHDVESKQYKKMENIFYQQ